MKKEEFIKLMQELVSIKKDEDALNVAFKKFEPDFNYISFNRYETLVVKSLKFAMNDTFDWISYWIYDCDCGKKDMKITDKNGKKIPIKTLSNLYNLLTNTNNE